MNSTTDLPTITAAGERIAERVGDLTEDQLRAGFTAALLGLDYEASEEVGSGGQWDGPALTTLNAMAEAVGLPGVGPGDFDSSEDFHV
ncbi:hypothetical protein [Amycolatopsis sp. WQ 127309]|uniref:hypothetical protein n=1 Tax=Amycolatopsis sp. WQ 127309 TaxID=2932773 RepID=UPI001FF34951|nr:hypothetical protein [Amycolatopsis sp. WQ 127309]UOZ03412.1 hypothetical protein MUY22_31720 [Amycolatopsis sp. WQ 127309]